jgi:hypothetical protein
MIGRTFGHYQVIEELGAGGMGVVYRARDLRLNRDVAFKVLPAELAADAGRLARFEREARALAALSHPHIVTIHSVEEAEGVDQLHGQEANLPSSRRTTGCAPPGDWPSPDWGAARRRWLRRAGSRSRSSTATMPGKVSLCGCSAARRGRRGRRRPRRGRAACDRAVVDHRPDHPPRPPLGPDPRPPAVPGPAGTARRALSST